MNEENVVQWLGTNESWEKIKELGMKNWSPGEMGSNTFYLSGELVQVGDWIVKKKNRLIVRKNNEQ